MMAANELVLSSERVVPIRILRSARFYAPQPVMELLRQVAHESGLVLALDIDALERTTRARVDRVMLLALHALATSGMQIALVARNELERARGIQRALADCLITKPAEVRDVVSGRLIAITDDRALLSSLRSDDVGIAIGPATRSTANSTVTDDASLRATLWWLVDRRAKAAR